MPDSTAFDAHGLRFRLTSPDAAVVEAFADLLIDLHADDLGGDRHTESGRALSRPTTSGATPLTRQHPAVSVWRSTADRSTRRWSKGP